MNQIKLKFLIIISCVLLSSPAFSDVLTDGCGVVHEINSKISSVENAIASGSTDVMNQALSSLGVSVPEAAAGMAVGQVESQLLTSELSLLKVAILVADKSCDAENTQKEAEKAALEAADLAKQAAEAVAAETDRQAKIVAQAAHDAAEALARETERAADEARRWAAQAARDIASHVCTGTWGIPYPC